MGRRDGRSGGGKDKEVDRREEVHFGGLDDTGGLGAPGSVNPTSASSSGASDRSRKSSDTGDPGTYEDANITGTEVTGGMGRAPGGHIPGRAERRSDDPDQQEDDTST